MLKMFGRVRGGVYALDFVKIGHFEEFQGINAPPDPTEHFQHDIYTYIYIYIYYICIYVYISGRILSSSPA